MQTINPKSLNIDELYGVIDKNTLEWKDGLASSILRRMNEQVDIPISIENAYS